MVIPSEFTNPSVGRLVPIRGHDARRAVDYDHWAFIPEPLPATFPLTDKTVVRVAEASMALGRLDEVVQRLPQPQLLVRPALRREAQSTTALEGTYAPLDAIFESELIEPAHVSEEAREVLNYVRAVDHALTLLATKPICMSVLADVQAMLVDGTHGGRIDQGRIRTGQVIIGDEDLPVEHARFIPPPPGDELVSGFSDWEKWVNAELDLPHVIRAAAAHYQFETLHPFNDGNGRLGRLIVTLQFLETGVLSHPVLNISTWLNERKQEYKDRLLVVSQTGDFDQWINFFCRAITDQATDGVRRVVDLETLRENIMFELRSDRARGVVNDVAESLIGYPILTVQDVSDRLGVSFPAANSAIQRLVTQGHLRELTGRNYGRIFAAPAVMSILTRP